ncbi:hypothetical protein [Kushneria avicenniae]|uniref:hypothetical protein n=1 Tax=Kushneria avicenniae TaxID=402385 RepID=UPI000B7F5120|nr:hypothetical protein [Kushneria avicenniae]
MKPVFLVCRGLVGTCVLTMLIGLNLRPSMAAIGPVVESIRHDVPLSFRQISLLTTLPVIAMGLGCFASGALVRRLGMSGVITLALTTIAASDALHWLGLGFAGL